MVDNLDRILASQPRLKPSGRFTSDVMRRVRQETNNPQPIAFPWWRLFSGLAFMLCVAGVGVAAAWSGSAGTESNWWPIMAWINNALIATGVIWVILGVPVSYFTVRFTLESWA